MSLLRPEMAVLLVLFPVFVALLVSAKRRKQKDLESLISVPLLHRIWQGKKPAGKRSAVLMSLAFLFVLLALMRPSWGYRFETYETVASEVVLALDTSQSMLSADIKPSRLERAKRKISDFLERARGDRVALVSFAGAAFLQTPLTEDPAAMRMFLDEVDTDLIPVPGSRIDLAIERSLLALGRGKVNAEKIEDEDAPSPDSKAIVIITDGETSSQEVLAAAARAAGMGIRIYVLGIGTEEGAPVPEKSLQEDLSGTLQDQAFQIQSSPSGFKKSSDGQLILSRLNPGLLSEIAQVGNGSYITSTPDDSDLVALYDRGIKRSLGAGTQGVRREKLPVEVFQWPLAIALVLLSVDTLFSWGMRFSLKAWKARRRMISTLIAVLGLFPLPTSPAWQRWAHGGIWLPGFAGDVALARDLFHATDQQARKSYDEKNFEDAATYWKKRIADSDQDVAPEDYYNLGNALYRAKDFAGAAASFDQAARKYLDKQRPEQAADALHNSGNASLLAGKLKEAVENYEKALEFRPKDEGTAKNLGLAKLLLAEQQQSQAAQNSNGSQSQGAPEQNQTGQKNAAMGTQNAEQTPLQNSEQSPGSSAAQVMPGNKDAAGQLGQQQDQLQSDQVQNKGSKLDSHALQGDSAAENKNGQSAAPDSADQVTERQKMEKAAEANEAQANQLEPANDDALQQSFGASGNELSRDELNKAMNRVQERPRMYLKQKALKEAREQLEKYGSPAKGGQDW